MAPFKNTASRQHRQLQPGLGQLSVRSEQDTVDDENVGPLDANDPGQKVLVAGGLDRRRSTSISARPDGSLRAFRAGAGGTRIGASEGICAGFARQRAQGGIRGRPGQALARGATEAGAIELTVRDTGGVDLAFAQYAQTLAVSRDAARRSFVDEMRASGEKQRRHPDMVAAVQALARFLESRGKR